jgi:hypothetical protein
LNSEATCGCPSQLMPIADYDSITRPSLPHAFSGNPGEIVSTDLSA